jgi:hypothetical protein
VGLAGTGEETEAGGSRAISVLITYIYENL